ncbi:MAG: ABC transporter substrate-binding protein [Alphaproteobacteria bacterium]|nr:ABC transporter substrate-binding protein [Alphaproteobacteria bacterium]
MLTLMPLAPAADADSPGDKISDGVVKIGYLIDQSSTYADETGIGSVTAARLAVEDFGKTVLGKPIELVFVDHQNKPDTASALARQWFDSDKVDAILDVTASSAALAVEQVAKEKNRIIIVSGGLTNRITSENCGPTAFHFSMDTYALSHAIGSAAVKSGADSWFFLTVDYTFGYDLANETMRIVKESGGKVLGEVRHPLNTSDFSSFLLQAQASGAKAIGIANAGNDTVNTVKQAHEFGLTQGGQKLITLLNQIPDVDSIGLETAQGLLLSEAFYWDMNDETRAFSKRFFAVTKKMPDTVQMGVYSATLHYLQAIQAAGTDAAEPVAAKMKELPVKDVFSPNGHVRADGLHIHDMYLFQVKSPAESKYPWDYYKLIATVPGDQAFQPLSEVKCPFLNK